MDLVKYNIDTKDMYLVSADDLEKIEKTGRIIKKSNAEKLVYVLKGEVSSHCESELDNNQAENFNIVLLKNKDNDKLSDSIVKIESIQKYIDMGLEDDKYDIFLMPISEYIKLKNEESNSQNHSKFEDEIIKNTSINRNFISLVSKSKLKDCLKNKVYKAEDASDFKEKVYLTKKEYIDEDISPITYTSDCNIEVIVLKNRNTNKFSDKPEKINSLFKFEESDIKDPIYDLEIMPLDIYLEKQSKKNKIKGKKVLVRKINPAPKIIEPEINFDFSFSDIVFYAQNRYLVKKENLRKILKTKKVEEARTDYSAEDLKNKVYISKIELINHEDNTRNVDFRVLVLRNNKTKKLSDKVLKIDNYFKYEEYGIKDPEYTLEKMKLTKYLHKRKITPTNEKLVENKTLKQSEEKSVKIHEDYIVGKQSVETEYRQLSFFATDPGEMFESISNNFLNKKVDAVDSKIKNTELEDDLENITWIEKERSILEGLQNNDTLYIIKDEDKVYFPYSVDEIEYYLKRYPTKYISRDKVVENEFSAKYSYYNKNTFKMRYSECYFLMRKSERKNIFKSIFTSIRIAKNKEMKPLYIATCRNEIELKSYYKAIKENRLDTFNLFRIENVKFKTK